MVPSTPIELADLVDQFYDQLGILGEFAEVAPDSIAEPFRRLLDHDHHMTVAMEEFHCGPVDVEILQSTVRGAWYAREILLRRQTDRVVVQYGIVRLNLDLVSAEVTSEILSGQKPLGRILIEHNVMRSLKLLHLFQIVPGPILKKVFSLVGPTQNCFGRTAIIYCDRVPAILLLEIIPTLVG